MLSRLFQRLFGSRSPDELASRRERRLDAKRRHHESDAPLWTPADRHLNPGPRHVEDVAPGTPGNFGSARTIDDEH
jgi:hypothetical protein